MNPLLKDFDTPFNTAPFHLLSNEHFLPAVKEAIQQAKDEINLIKTESSPNFATVVEALDKAGERLGIIASVFYNLNSAETSDEIQAIAREISPLLTAHSNDILLDKALFQQIEPIFQAKDTLQLSPEQLTLLEKTYKSFVRNGALLQENDKQRLREIDQQLAQLQLSFGENVLAETNKFELVIEEEASLRGLPNAIKEAAAQTAEEKGYSGKWVFTLAFPSYIPFMTYAEDRDLRKKLFMAYNTKACKNDALDNKSTIINMLQLKHERANLLGYPTFADFVLEERMAKSAANVQEFLRNLLEKSKPKASEELAELQGFAKQLDGLDSLEKWDLAYYSEKLKKERYAIDDEILRPYFKLENVIEGVFHTASKLFDIQFKENKNIPTYHPDVITYEVQDLNGNHVGVFYADFFPRSGKRNGAWMTSFRGQSKSNGINKRPHVSIVCNFTKPTKSTPSLLTFNEVTTLFHEFGHALHGMLADGTYESLSGTSVFWDFVELPSQLFENWCYEKDCLDLFARHYETGEAIPQVLLSKIKAVANFQQGTQTLRQISFGLLDMAYHSTDPSKITDVAAFEKAIMEETSLLPAVDGTLMSTSFSHIFQGGYAAGYYSYKWAEVLDADAFELFLENGVFHKETAHSFKSNILAAGGSEHPAILYRRFRGRDPKPDALLKRSGLI